MCIEHTFLIQKHCCCCPNAYDTAQMAVHNSTKLKAAFMYLYQSLWCSLLSKQKEITF